ncbi:MAG: 2',3'-cyclic-nucleotide 2'-phosphodiesterase (5'-nucleotidase family) [Saprospiraceae bacterium]|jgi:2',3'-cyclic-nucleotide 2'-phosphodiesterase (5'-nucleotidase family)|tara:strand:- start:84 stop:842 length:759 start_codon:yes stop_codon:yes gene_type:complete
MKMYQLKNLLILVLFVSIGGCSKQVYTADIDTSYYRISKRNKSDKELDKLIAPYKAQLDAKMNEVIAINPEEMAKARPSSVMGNWFSDALLEEASRIYGVDIDMSMQNYGGLRVPSLGKGDISVGEIYELMPFDNKLVLLELDGITTKKLLDKIAEKGGWPISHTLSMEIDGDQATNIKIKGQDFDINKTYTVALADYIADGGDDCFFLADGKRTDNDLLIRDIIIDHLRNKPEEEKVIVLDKTARIKNSNY